MLWVLNQRDSSLEHPKYMFNLMCKKIITIFTQKVSLSGRVFSDVAFCTQQCSLSAEFMAKDGGVSAVC